MKAKATGFLRDLTAMPDRKTFLDPASEAPLPAWWTAVLIVAAVAIVVAIIVALVLGLLHHHHASPATHSVSPPLHLATALVSSHFGRS